MIVYKQYKSFAFLIFLVLLGLFFHEAAVKANSSSKKKDSCITVQNFYGSALSKVLMKQLSQMEQKIDQKLSELEKKVDLCYSGKPGSCKKVQRNCAEIFNCGLKKNGVYKINPDGKGAFDVFCDQTTAGGGWTVFQKRLDGSVNFFRGWTEYKNGFGNLKGEYWLGLDKIHRLTQARRYKLRVDLEDITGKTAYAEYGYFGVTSENAKYKLSLGSYSGTAGDSLSSHRGMAFSTKDRDHDKSGSNCAVLFKGAWWYEGCHHSNLNGLYLHGAHKSSADGINWYHWKGYNYSAKRAEMKLRPVGFIPK